MIQFTDKLKKDILKANFIILGETHGIKENLDVVKYFINFFTDQKIPVIFAIEWPHNLNSEINEYIRKDKNAIDWKSWIFSKSPDGRISKEHLKFLEWLKKKQIQIRCFDNSGKNWNDRDKKMAMDIVDLFKKNKDHKVLAFMGSLHAKKHPFEFNDRKCKPLTSYLPKDKTVSFKISYSSGSYFNMSFKKIEPTNKIKSLSKKSEIIKSKDKDCDYDYEIILNKATPITILDKKNMIRIDK